MRCWRKPLCKRRNACLRVRGKPMFPCSLCFYSSEQAVCQKADGTDPLAETRSEKMRQSGGCSCGAVRFTIARHLYAQICHCDACKKRTGSAYGISVVIGNADLEECRGETRTFTRIAESGHAVEYDFCPQCATTIRWRVAVLQGWQVFAGGAFDNPRAFEAAGEMYTSEALPWARIGCELTRAGAPDEAYRVAMIAKTKSAP
jgi:hypothetical protein